MNPPESASVLVVKVGGSLLAWDELPDRLRALLHSRRVERPIIVVGGGAIVDCIRELDSVYRLGEVRAHQLAMRGLELTAHVLADLIAELQLVDDTESLETAWERGRFPLLNIGRILAADQSVDQNWSVTSDSLAARIAARLQARELLLLKSTPIPPGIDRVEAARLGLVDPAFPEFSALLDHVAALNFRDPVSEVITLRRPSARSG